MGDLTRKLISGSRLSARELRSLLRQLGYTLARQRGSHEQWVKSGRTFTIATHGKEVPWYLLDSLRKLIEESDENEDSQNQGTGHVDKEKA